MCCILFVVVLIVIATVRKGPYDFAQIRKQFAELKSSPNPFKNIKIHFENPLFNSFGNKEGKDSLLRDTEDDYEPTVTVDSDTAPSRTTSEVNMVRENSFNAPNDKEPQNGFRNPAFGVTLISCDSSADLMPRVDTSASTLSQFADTEDESFYTPVNSGNDYASDRQPLTNNKQERDKVTFYFK